MDFGRANLTASLEQVATAQYQVDGIRQNLHALRVMKSGTTRWKLTALAQKRRLLCVTFQLGALELEEDISSHGFPVAVELRDFDSFAAMRDSGLTPDLALFRSHQLWKVDGTYDFSDLIEAPRRFFDCVNLIWLWDHHHAFEASGKMALLADIVLPMHETGADYLKVFSDYVFSAVPAASAQWGGPRFVQQVYREHQGRPRSDRLYGGFVEYPGFRRNAFIRQCMTHIPDHALTLLPPTQARDIQHFDVATRRERLAEWMGYKSSLVCALSEDIPIRVLDGLLAGQIPLVPYNLNGFDRLISPALQAELPIVRYDPYDLGSVEAAWRTAIWLFDRAGPAGAARRHRYAADNHLMKHRVADIVLGVLNSARPFVPRP
jgi:hypothetical protein